MLYYSEFTSLDGHNYRVDIQTSTGSAENRKLILGDTPFVTSMDADGKSLYTPIKSSGATVQILTSELPFDIYSSKPNEVKVSLTDTDTSKVVWTGYLTPCAYSQGFDEHLEYVEFECVDGIAVLKDMLYVAPVREIKSFLQIVIKCLGISGCYKTLYVTDNMYLSNYSSTCLLEKLMITEQNFFDIKDDETQGDDDVAWTAYDVLFEICQYLGYTLITDGEDVYILDYDAIKKKQTAYWKYNLTAANPTGTKVTLQHSYKIAGDSYAANGTNVSLTEVFNKITVVSDFYEIKNLAGDIESASNLVNITSSSDSILKQWQNTNGNFLESDVFTAKNGLGQDESFFITINKDASGHLMFVMGKFYKNKLITHKHYLHNAQRTVDSESKYSSDMRFTKLWDAKGSIYVAYFTKRVESKSYNSWRVNYPASWDSLTSDQKLAAYQKLMQIGNMQSKSLTKMLLLLNHPTNHIEWNEIGDYPFCTISSSQTISSVGGEGAYLLLKGSIIRHDAANNPYPMNGDAPRNSNHKKSFIWANEGFVLASLKWGNLWWHDENSPGKSEGYWDTEPGKFKILYIPPDQNSGGMGDWYDKELKFYNTAGVVWGADKEGYYIPCPDSGNLSGSPELTIYAPYDSDLKQVRGKGQKDRKHKRCYTPRALMIKGLELTANYADDVMNQEAKSAKTCYTNVVEGYCKEAKELKFKICTADNKNSSYSLVSYSHNGTDNFVDTVVSRASGLTLRPEEQYVNDFVSQYENPHIIYECALKLSCQIKPYSMLTDTTLSKRDFIIDTMNYDYKQGSVELSIIEKA